MDENKKAWINYFLGTFITDEYLFYELLWNALHFTNKWSIKNDFFTNIKIIEYPDENISHTNTKTQFFLFAWKSSSMITY